MKKMLIDYMKKYFSWTYNYNLSRYTFFVSDFTSRALRIEPFVQKHFNSQWSILGNTLFIECQYFEGV